MESIKKFRFGNWSVFVNFYLCWRHELNLLCSFCFTFYHYFFFHPHPSNRNIFLTCIFKYGTFVTITLSIVLDCFFEWFMSNNFFKYRDSPILNLYSRSKKKRNTPIYFSTNYLTEMKMVPIIMDYCLLQFDALKFILGVRLHGGVST